MTQSDLLRLMASLGARLYDPAYLEAVMDAARQIAKGGKVVLKWPLNSL